MLNARKGPLCNLRTTKALISLRICAGWSGRSLSAYRINGYCSICRRTGNVQIRLHGCARSSGLSLFAYGIMAFLPRCALNSNVQIRLHIRTIWSGQSLLFDVLFSIQRLRSHLLCSWKSLFHSYIICFTEFSRSVQHQSLKEILTL